MKVKNGKIIEATENELFEHYLKLGFDEIFDFNTYKRRCEASGVKIIGGEDNAEEKE
jgi:hypothetical protein